LSHLQRQYQSPARTGLSVLPENLLSPAPLKERLHPVQVLQRRIGNQATQRLLRNAARGMFPHPTRLLQRDAEAGHVPQETVVKVDMFKFLRTVSVIAFDAASSPGGTPAPASTDLTSRQNGQVTVPLGSSGTVSIASMYFWQGHLTPSAYFLPQGGSGEAAVVARFRVSPDGNSSLPIRRHKSPGKHRASSLLFPMSVGP